MLGEVLRATFRAGPTRDKLDPENAARDAGVDGGASLRSVLRVQARSAVPVVQATNQIEARWGTTNGTKASDAVLARQPMKHRRH